MFFYFSPGRPFRKQKIPARPAFPTHLFQLSPNRNVGKPKQSGALSFSAFKNLNLLDACHIPTQTLIACSF
ncbi:hypothetical protein CLV24_11517 [Pontibacter ummariensis]|uniref:Uncharacterized protein n=1 Tax=Pontibacter ummariensis TaxID=1610492 RepID=A0A239HWS1_9BACT|nr:hypothetical protein CLV24_11517 [Pontibacter ummariensis]SNS85830.1 hypothetical protein SAMN06296052_11517 [Pontibacter ummariensis]